MVINELELLLPKLCPIHAIVLFSFVAFIIVTDSPVVWDFLCSRCNSCSCLPCKTTNCIRADRVYLVYCCTPSPERSSWRIVDAQLSKYWWMSKWGPRQMVPLMGSLGFLQGGNSDRYSTLHLSVALPTGKRMKGPVGALMERGCQAKELDFQWVTDTDCNSFNREKLIEMGKSQYMVCVQFFWFFI